MSIFSTPINSTNYFNQYPQWGSTVPSTGSAYQSSWDYPTTSSPQGGGGGVPWLNLLGLGTSFLSGYSQQKSAENIAKANREAQERMAREQREWQTLMEMANIPEADRDDQLTRAKSALEATQGDPFVQQRARTKMALAQALSEGKAGTTWGTQTLPNGRTIPKASYSLGPYVSQFLAPQARASEDAKYQAIASMINPNAPTSSMSTQYGAGIGASLDEMISGTRTTEQKRLEQLAEERKKALQKALLWGNPLAEARGSYTYDPATGGYLPGLWSGGGGSGGGQP